MMADGILMKSKGTESDSCCVFTELDRYCRLSDCFYSHFLFDSMTLCTSDGNVLRGFPVPTE